MRIGIATLAEIEELEKTPLAERLAAGNTYDMIRHGASLDPQAPALSFFRDGNAYREATTYSYADFLGQVTRTANFFHDLGVGAGDVVSYLLPNLPQTHFVLWGGQAAGIVNPINPMLNPEVIGDICAHVRTRILVALGEAPGSDIWEKVEKIRPQLPDLKAVVRVMGPSDEAAGIYGYEEMVGRYPADHLLSGREIGSDEIAAIYHTGGTTGVPKLAPHTHGNEVSMVEMVHLCFSGLGRGDTFMCGLPMFHVNATTATGSLPLATGGHILLLGPRGYRDPGVIRNFFRIVEHYRGAFFSAVPTVLSMLLANLDPDADISSLKFLLCGAAPLSVPLFASFEEKTGMKIVEGYGQTEAVCGSIVNPPDGRRKIGSVGLRLPYQQARVFILTGDGRFQREARTNEIGTLCLSGPNVFPGYLDSRQNSRLWPRPGWLNTGDLARQDEDGYFWLTGRSKDLIIRGGHNIDPALIEKPAQELPAVALAAAVGQPDAHAGEVPVLFVQLQPGASASPEEIKAELAGRIGERAAVPREVFILEQLPLTAVGKIFKPKLRWLAIEQVYRRELAGIGNETATFVVSVGEDSVHGTLATITIKAAAGGDRQAIEQQVAARLQAYTTRYELEFA
ncbi:MAG: acyl-CoA synthetase [Deltaproteobacteria bacterium]|nr:acyl-CoA synthetase [Deltaproteobacteria bacterium]